MPINPSPAVQRAAQVLWYLAEHPSEAHTVSQLSRTLNIPRATCDSILQALTQQGFANRRNHDMGYELGASCLALASAAQATNPVLNMANRQADRLARDLQACVVVSTIIDGEARAVTVFDRGPATLLRARVGQAIPLTPPFGVVFVAWDSATSEHWLKRGGSETHQAEAERWRQSLQFARRHGYSFSVFATPGVPFGRVLEELLEVPDSEPYRRTRDELIDQLRHSEYLATQLDHNTETQLIQLSAPVFDADGAVAASLMVLGSMRPMRGEEVETLGRRVVQAADQATTTARELRLGEPAAGI
ncbi:helix-turn-helix domain-containing protein [Mycobacterium sp. 852002-51971_SCH5477799-a]|uniref:helix-turn-helix domain-containing protein n=1 Tax=Mycobacterium sp. 852002-51971_SCH5477799-a TaxID=1834106 RepID=UPI0018D2FFEC|nr:helix-turn-helix domain-containing protein [Mycobacterium sp. 852002-51971_SCH5477799-a]